MKKSMLNVIILALVLINLVVTSFLTFSLVSTNNKTNTLISKVASIIDLEVAGGLTSEEATTGSGSIDSTEYIDVTNNDDTKITVSYSDGGKTHYAVFTCSLAVNNQHKDYATKLTSINNGMKAMVNEITNEALKFSYDQLASNKSAIEGDLLTTFKDMFQTDMITSVMITILVQ